MRNPVLLEAAITPHQTLLEPFTDRSVAVTAILGIIALLNCGPAWLIRSHAAIVVKVVSSWLIAVALLAATLQLLPVTPGYIPDHLE